MQENNTQEHEIFQSLLNYLYFKQHPTDLVIVLVDEFDYSQRKLHHPFEYYRYDVRKKQRPTSDDDPRSEAEYQTTKFLLDRYHRDGTIHSLRATARKWGQNIVEYGNLRVIQLFALNDIDLFLSSSILDSAISSRSLQVVQMADEALRRRCIRRYKLKTNRGKDLRRHRRSSPSFHSSNPFLQPKLKRIKHRDLLEDEDEDDEEEEEEEENYTYNNSNHDDDDDVSDGVDEDGDDEDNDDDKCERVSRGSKYHHRYIEERYGGKAIMTMNNDIEDVQQIKADGYYFKKLVEALESIIHGTYIDIDIFYFFEEKLYDELDLYYNGEKPSASSYIHYFEHSDLITEMIFSLNYEVIFRIQELIFLYDVPPLFESDLPVLLLHSISDVYDIKAINLVFALYPLFKHAFIKYPFALLNYVCCFYLYV